MAWGLETNIRGPQGPVGPASVVPGPQGEQGDVGPQGPQGVPGESGTTILDGSGVPLPTLGAGGDYYVDNDGNTLYGPKEASPFQTAEYIHSSTTPIANSGGNYRLSNDYKMLVSGQIIGARFWRSATSGRTSRQLFLFNTATGTLLATSSTTSGESGAGWFTVTFPSPVPVAVNSLFTIAYDEPANFVYDNPPVVVDASHAIWLGGRYDTAGASFPTITTANSYVADLLWQPAFANVWPVAVSGASAGGGGSGILNGNGPPADALGVDGDYYVDGPGDVFYGPKTAGGAPGAPEYALLNTTPAATQLASFRYGNDFKFLKAGQITGARFWRLAGSSYTTRQLYLFNSAQVLIATSNASTEGAAFVGWIEVTFPTPIPVTVNQTVTICYDDAAANAYTNGSPATADPTATDHVIGRYGLVGSGFPANSGSFDFSVDLLWQRSGNVWPVAVSGVPAGGTTSQVLTKTSATDYAANWQTPSAGGITDAPNDGKPYVRKSLAWDDFTDDMAAKAPLTHDHDRIVSTPADMSAGFKTAGNRFVVNDGPSLGGTDVMTVSETGLLTTNNIISNNYVQASGGYFLAGSSASIYLGNTTATASTVYLRPNGYLSTTGQTTIDSTGAMTTAAGITATTGSLTVSAYCISNAGAFIGNAAQAILGTPASTAGNVYLRPNGYGSATGQTTIDSAGTLNIAAGCNVGTNLTTGPTDTTPTSALAGNILYSTGVYYSKKTATTANTHVAFFNNAAVTPTQVGAITTNASTTAYVTSSDENLKNFIDPPYDPLAAIEIIRADPVRHWNWKNGDGYAIGWGAQTSYNVSQDLAVPPPPRSPEEIAVEGAGTDPKEPGYVPWGMDQSKRTPYLWAALTWALDRIESLEARLAALEAG